MFKSMEETELIEIALRRQEARKSMEETLREKWQKSDLHLNQLHKRTGIGYHRIGAFLVKGGSADHLTDKELIDIHTALS